MACACKVNQQLSYLQKHYGMNKEMEGSKNTKNLDIGFICKKILTGSIVIIFIPIIFIGIIINLIFKNRILKVDKFIKFAHGRK